MEDIHTKILWEGFGLRCHGSTRTRTGLLCKTDKGLRELKKARVSKEDILFANDMKKGLYRNGFSGICLFVSAVDGQPFYQWNNNFYILEEPMPKEVLEEQNPETFQKGAAVLGNMHCLSRGCYSLYSRWNKERLPAYFAKRRNEFAKIRKRIQKHHGYSSVDLIVLREYGHFMERAVRAEELLKEADYGALVEKTQEMGGFYHKSFKGDHLRMGEDGRIFVGGFEGCSADVPALDFAAYLKRFMRKTEGNKENLAQMLTAYESVCPLSEKEWKLVLAMIVFPDKFMKLMNEFYNKRQVCLSPAMEERLQEAAEEAKKGEKLEQMLLSFR